MTVTTDLAVREQEVFAGLEQAANLPAGSVSVVGLRLVDIDIAYDDWHALGVSLGLAYRWVRFAVGDWLNFGIGTYGEDEAYQATESSADRYDLIHRVTGLKPETLRNYAYVTRQVALSRRRPELDFGHHQAVAPLEPADQVEWLQRAVDAGWKRDDLRAAIKSAGAGGPAEPPGDRPDWVSVTDQIDRAARDVARLAEQVDGGWLVPDEPMTRLLEAIRA